MEAWKINRGPSISPRTWNIEVETLKQIFAYAKDTLRIVLDNPVEGLKRKKEPKAGIVIPSKEQFRALVDELRSGHRSTGEAADLVEFLAYSGCRVAEARSVRWRDINAQLGTLLITGGELGTKNHEARVIPLFAPLARLVQSMRTRKPLESDDAFVFRISNATPSDRSPAIARIASFWASHDATFFLFERNRGRLRLQSYRGLGGAQGWRRTRRNDVRPFAQRTQRGHGKADCVRRGSGCQPRKHRPTEYMSPGRRRGIGRLASANRKMDGCVRIENC